MKKIAFIDLGSNSVRFVIMAIDESNFSYRLIHQQKEAIRLSEGLSDKNILTKAAIARALYALKSFAKIATQIKVDQTIAVATAAVRLAKNGKDFIKQVFKETGFNLNCISGKEEARLGYLGVINTMHLKDFVLFDLGGASIEVTLVKNRKIYKSRSFPMGALTLTEKFKQKKELRPNDIKCLQKYIINFFNEEPWLKQVNLPLVGIGGTVRNIAKIHQRKHNYPIHKLHNYELSSEDITKLLNSISSKTLAERKKIPGLSTERADIIIPGIHIIKELMDYTNSQKLYISGCGLREGLFFDFYGKKYNNGNCLHDDVLIESTENYLYNLNIYDFQHNNFVRQYSKILFDQLAPLHNASPRIKKLLEIAAMLHDAGKAVNYYSHARHSTYITLNAPIYGLTHHEQALCAFIAGFSHGNKSKLQKAFISSKLLSANDWKLVRKIALILAIVEELDESHDQSVLRIQTKIAKDSVQLIIHLSKDRNMPPYTSLMEKLKKQFKKEYKKQLEIKINYAK